MDSSQDYSTTCPWAYLAECVEADMFPQELLDKLTQENKTLKDEQLTEENAIRYVYENTSEYDDWVKGSEVYKELEEKNKQLKEEVEIQRKANEAYEDLMSGIIDKIKKLKE